MVLVVHYVQSLTAGIALAEGVIFIPANPDYTIVLDSNLKPTEIRSQYTACLFPIHYFNLLIPTPFPYDTISSIISLTDFISVIEALT